MNVMGIRDDYLRVGNVLALMLFLSIPMLIFKYLSLTKVSSVFHVLWLLILWIPAVYVLITFKPFNRKYRSYFKFSILIALSGPLLIFGIPLLMSLQGSDFVSIDITFKQILAVIFLNDILSGEIVWRGFVLPLLKRHLSFINAIYITTFFEVLWKGPVMILSYLYGRTFDIGWLVNDFLMLVFMSVWLSWLYWISGEDLRIVILSRISFAMMSLIFIKNTVLSRVGDFTMVLLLLLYIWVIGYYISKTSNFLERKDDLKK